MSCMQMTIVKFFTVLSFSNDNLNRSHYSHQLSHSCNLHPRAVVELFPFPKGERSGHSMKEYDNSKEKKCCGILIFIELEKQGV